GCESPYPRPACRRRRPSPPPPRSPSSAAPSSPPEGRLALPAEKAQQPRCERVLEAGDRKVGLATQQREHAFLVRLEDRPSEIGLGQRVVEIHDGRPIILTSNERYRRTAGTAVNRITGEAAGAGHNPARRLT